jgi:hypothetical protein
MSDENHGPAGSDSGNGITKRVGTAERDEVDRSYGVKWRSRVPGEPARDDRGADAVRRAGSVLHDGLPLDVVPDGPVMGILL